MFTPTATQSPEKQHQNNPNKPNNEPIFDFPYTIPNPPSPQQKTAPHNNPNQAQQNQQNHPHSQQNPPQSQQNPPQSQQNPPQSQLNPPPSQQNPTQSQQNPPQSQQNPPQAQQNPPQSQLNPPQSQLNPPQSQQNPPQSQLNPPQSQLNPPQSQQNPPQSQQNPTQSQQNPTQQNQQNPTQSQQNPTQQNQQNPPQSQQNQKIDNPPKKEKEQAAKMSSKHPLLLPGNILSLWGEAADLLIEHDHGDAALLYFHILRKGHGFPSHWDRARAIFAQEALSHLGLYQKESCANEPPPVVEKLMTAEPPQYNADDLAMRLENQSFQSIREHVGHILGKSLTRPDLESLLRLYDHLGFTAETITILVNYAITDHEKRHGKAKRPTMKYIEKIGYEWDKVGITTYESAIAYVNKLKKRDPWVTEVFMLFKFEDYNLRSPSESQEKFLSQWYEWGYTPEVLQIAFERMSLNTQKFSWAYIHKIVESWKNIGAYTPKEIEEKEKMAPNPKKKGKNGTTGQGAYGGQVQRNQNGPRAFNDPLPSHLATQANNEDDLDLILKTVENFYSDSST